MGARCKDFRKNFCCVRDLKGFPTKNDLEFGVFLKGQDG